MLDCHKNLTSLVLHHYTGLLIATNIADVGAASTGVING